MKSYRNVAAALVLALVLSTSAFAGEMHTDVAPPPPPTANSTAQTTTTDGVMHTDAAEGVMTNDTVAGEIHTGVAATLTQIALSVLTALP